MTIAIGIPCDKGIVICTDTQVSVPDYFKYFENKIDSADGKGWALLFGYADDPGLYEQVKTEIIRRYRGSYHAQTFRLAYAVCRKTLTEVGWPYKDLSLQILIGVCCHQGTRLLAFDGKSLNWMDGIQCFGVGDCSLTRYLSKLLYYPQISVEDGVKVGIYMVAKAKDHVDHVGGDTVVYQLRNRGKPIRVSPEEVSTMQNEILQKEKSAIKGILDLE